MRLRNLGFAFLDLEPERAWFHLDVGAWLIFDRLGGRGAHHAASLLHFYPIFNIEVRDDRALARSRSFVATVIPLGCPPGKIKATRGDDPEFSGWHAPDFGIKYPAGVLALEWTNLELPWVDGYLVVPGNGDEYCDGVIDTAFKALSIEVLGKRYSLPLR
jgi:hypothetical protein